MNTKPVFVAGYVRNRRIHKVDNTNNVLGMVIVTALVVLFLAVFWKFTLGLGGTISLAVFAKKYYAFVNDPSRMIVKYYGHMPGFVQNIREMIRG